MSKRARGDGGGGNDWLNTYADMVTLLLTFFVLMLSMSTVNEEKFNAFIKSISTLPEDVIQQIVGSGALTGDPIESEEFTESETSAGSIDELYEKLKEYVDGSDQSGAVEISKVEDIIYIRFSSALFFKPDQYELLESSYETLSFIGEGLKQDEEQIRMINICGHTASTGDENYKVNSWILSGERAASVARYFDDAIGIDPRKMMVLGYGKEYPVVDNDSEENRAQNRRVELIIVGQKSAVDFNAYSFLGDVYSQQGTGTDATTNTTTPPDTAQPPDQTGNEGPLMPETIDRVERDVSPYDD